MILWNVLVLLIGGALAFFHRFLCAHNLVWCLGIVVMLISAGMALRIAALARRGEREAHLEKISRLEKELSEKGGADDEDFDKKKN